MTSLIDSGNLELSFDISGFTQTGYKIAPPKNGGTVIQYYKSDTANSINKFNYPLGIPMTDNQSQYAPYYLGNPSIETNFNQGDASSFTVLSIFPTNGAATSLLNISGTARWSTAFGSTTSALNSRVRCVLPAD
jgi:hypothetical protein